MFGKKDKTAKTEKTEKTEETKVKIVERKERYFWKAAKIVGLPVIIYVGTGAFCYGASLVWDKVYAPTLLNRSADFNEWVARTQVKGEVVATAPAAAEKSPYIAQLAQAATETGDYFALNSQHFTNAVKDTGVSSERLKSELDKMGYTDRLMAGADYYLEIYETAKRLAGQNAAPQKGKHTNAQGYNDADRNGMDTLVGGGL